MTDKEKALIDAFCIPNGDITINQVLEQVWFMSNKLGQYMAVGTVEEFKELKEKEQKKITTWLNDARIEIIDEFVKHLKKDLEKMSDIDYEKGIRGDNEAYGRSQAYGESMDLVDKIAEQLKSQTKR